MSRIHRYVRSIRRALSPIAPLGEAFSPMGTIDIELTKILVYGEDKRAFFKLTRRSTRGDICATGERDLDVGDILRVPWVTTVDTVE